LRVVSVNDKRTQRQRTYALTRIRDFEVLNDFAVYRNTVPFHHIIKYVHQSLFSIL